MRIRLQHLLFASLVVSMVSLAYGLNYQYFSDTEQTVFGERNRYMYGDTGRGARTNDSQALEGVRPVIDLNDFFIIGGPRRYWLPTSHLVQGAPVLPFPVHADWIRQQAHLHGRFFSHGFSMQARVHLELSSMRVWWWPNGTPFDSTVSNSLVILPDSAIVFFDTPHLQLSGSVNRTLIIGASGEVGLEDNVIYASSTGTNGQLSPRHTEKFALVAEGDIKILNTPANGRNDSNNRGLSQPHPDSTSIALNGMFIALGESFTFEQQNDPDSGYCYQYPPGTLHRDDRGTIHLWGALAQKRRGYVHRSNNGSTGYLKDYHFDEKLKFWHVGVFDGRENVIEPASVNFRTIPAGTTARDTVTISNDFVPLEIDSIRATGQFAALLPDSYRWEQKIALAFVPTHSGTFADTIRFYVSYYHQWLSIPVRGVATALAADPDGAFMPSSFSLSASPNPFNPGTRITFALPEPGDVDLNIFDTLGRRVAELQKGFLSAGEHAVLFDGMTLTAGIYFARLTTSHREVAIKLMLLK